MVNLFVTLDLTLFILVAILIFLSIVPISLTPTSAPSPVSSTRLNLKALYRSSPVGVVGCLLAGAVEGAFWSLGTVFAQGRGLETADITLLMAVFVLGGTLSQLPLGWASGQIDRRIVILIVAFGAVITGLVIGLDIFPSSLITFVVSACHGALMIPIYALCISHANDVVLNERMVETSGGLLLSFLIGATAGPITASMFMRNNQPCGFFIFIGAILCLLGMFVIIRLLTEKRKRPLEKPYFAQTSAA
jgi:MFS family permease